ncbi:hypothetical protein OGATHE_000737 [Ogataea polymorpha]|uniref:Uncharacterized protein n=1 Tax=Ogataea polymorpha TaxID=460523 RepID=A0A9P8PTY3_9ASCO|nr:hypothetical protein OGATHE_000737 [Ogataea polymorpha]
MNTINKMAMAPPLPIIAYAEIGRTRPLDSCCSVSPPGTGKLLVCSRARHARPMVVAKAYGKVNQHRPPRVYPVRAPAGLAAIAFWNS